MTDSSHDQRTESIALLDVDGTLIDGVPLGIQFAGHLADTSAQFPRSAYEGMIAEGQRYRSEETYSYTRAAGNIVDLWCEGVAGMRTPEVASAAREFVHSLPDATLEPARTLLGTLAERSFRSYLISISPQEVLVPFADAIAPRPDHDVEVYGTVAATDGTGQYSGVAARDMAGAKDRIVDTITGSQSPERTIAFGDAATDEPLFDAATVAILISPKPELRELSREKQWNVELYDNVAECNASLDWDELWE